MPFPTPDYSKRDYLLPEGCKDVTDLLRREAAAAIERDGDGDVPVTRWVQLPEMVSVKFLAEISGQHINAIVKTMYRLRILVEYNRSIRFEDAERVLRKFGIAAEREKAGED